jgi:hypothetical protein
MHWINYSWLDTTPKASSCSAVTLEIGRTQTHKVVTNRIQVLTVPMLLHFCIQVEGTGISTSLGRWLWNLVCSVWSGNLYPVHICTSQSLFSHSYVVNEWLNRHCNVQIDIGIRADELGISADTHVILVAQHKVTRPQTILKFQPPSAVAWITAAHYKNAYLLFHILFHKTTVRCSDTWLSFCETLAPPLPETQKPLKYLTFLYIDTLDYRTRHGSHPVFFWAYLHNPFSWANPLSSIWMIHCCGVPQVFLWKWRWYFTSCWGTC